MTALVLVDIQNDFLPGGALAVPGGDEIIETVNPLQSRFPIVVATQDWHPPNHLSFAVNHPGKKVHAQVELKGLPQTLWPVHCVQHSRGAQLAPGLDTLRIARVFQKGTDPEVDSYSGFFDNGHLRSTGLDQWLRGKGAVQVFLCGLATDYCVKFTALDAVELGFEVRVIEDACRAVELVAGDAARAFDEMRRTGVRLVSSAEAVM